MACFSLITQKVRRRTVISALRSSLLESFSVSHGVSMPSRKAWFELVERSAFLIAPYHAAAFNESDAVAISFH